MYMNFFLAKKLKNSCTVGRSVYKVGIPGSIHVSNICSRETDFIILLTIFCIFRIHSLHMQGQNLHLKQYRRATMANLE